MYDVNPMMCIDTETTGLDLEQHEIIQISAILLNPDFTPTQNHYTTYVKPMHSTNDEAFKINKIPNEVLEVAPTPDVVIKDFEAWAKQFLNTSNKYHKIDPLGHFYTGFDYMFLKKFFGDSLYDEMFSRNMRDSKVAVNILQDMKILGRLKSTSLEKILKKNPILKNDIDKYLSERFEDYDIECYHDAWHDALRTSIFYNCCMNTQYIWQTLKV